MNIAYTGLFAAALIALVLSISAAFFLGNRGPWGSMWTFFLVLFLALSTVSIYVAPIGPMYRGIAWVPIVVAGVIVTVLLIAAMPHKVDKDAARGDKDADVINARPEFPTTPVGRFFWVLIILFVIAIIIGMANPQPAL